MLINGQRIGQYTIESHYADGTIGKVYKARDELGIQYAIKVLLKNVDNEWNVRFEREFNILRRCNHPSIVKVYDHGTVVVESVSRPYIVMDFVEGQNLKELKEGLLSNLDVWQVTKIVRQAAKALEHAHSLSIVHRDLKPGNILIRKIDGQVVLVDFGLAKDFAHLDADVTFFAIGARGYSSYHKTKDPKNAAYSDDIWSLGAIYYYLLAGKSPFYEKTEHDLIEKIKAGEYVGIRKLVQDIPEELAVIMDKMLDKGLTSDYVNCRHLLRDLDRLDMFISDLNKVFISDDIANDKLGNWQLLINKIYGPVNFDRNAGEVFARLTASMGRTNSLLADLQEESTVKSREGAIEHLARSFVWLCGFAIKVGVDLEHAVWQKYPRVCPYCLGCHDEKSSCSKATKGPIDIWRLRDLANERASFRPKCLREWEKVFAKIYPMTAAIGIEYLSKKIIEEVGEVGREFTKRSKRRSLLRETGIDSLGFEIANVFAWTCQASLALRIEQTPDDESVLANATAKRLRYEICPFCRHGVCTCDPEEETETKMPGYTYLEYIKK